ncbi:selT-like protein isoform X1 [Aegilops tauschii subsp. strangulata]|uniref:selT-like protein n=1 Tax=Triticum aestivum TaxID=4565 RepID=UPI00098AF266|nr:selT-like protein [Triticum aestivum]
MAMDRVQLLLVGLPAILFISDLSHIFAPPPPHLRHPHGHPPHHPHAHPPHHPHQPHPPHHHPHPPHHHHHPDPAAAAIQQPNLEGGAGFGTTVELQFCASCSYKGNAMTMKRMLETSFPGINVFLHNYPPAFPKRVLSKIMPVIQVGAIATIMAGDQIFPRLGITPPPLFYSLRANRFGTMATIWLIGNFAQSFLQSSGAFEVYCNGDLVFSKLAEQRFPSEFELRDLIGSRLPPSPFGKNMGNVLS